MDYPQTTRKTLKRKADDHQDNERLSKRLSLLNLERNGQKLYVPVERPATSPKTTTQHVISEVAEEDDMMHLDDTKHKVYIYDLDAELSDSDTSDDGKLVFLPDIRKHLRETRIPPTIWANSEGELAGQQQMVLYNIPTSLTVPEEQDSVRKAIIEARARARAKTREEHNRSRETTIGAGILHRNGTVSPERGLDAGDWYRGVGKGMQESVGNQVFPTMAHESANTQVFPSIAYERQMEEPQVDDYDPDAMDLG